MGFLPRTKSDLCAAYLYQDPTPTRLTLPSHLTSTPLVHHQQWLHLEAAPAKGQQGPPLPRPQRGVNRRRRPRSPRHRRVAVFVAPLGTQDRQMPPRPLSPTLRRKQGTTPPHQWDRQRVILSAPHCSTLLRMLLLEQQLATTTTTHNTTNRRHFYPQRHQLPRW